MKKLAIIFLLLLVRTSVFSQWSFNFSGGYEVPIITYNDKRIFPKGGEGVVFGFNLVDQYGDTTTIRHTAPYFFGRYVYFSGPNSTLSLSYRINRFLRISFGVFYLNNRYLAYSKSYEHNILFSNEFTYSYYYHHSDSGQVEYNSVLVHSLKNYLREVKPLLSIDFVKDFGRWELSLSWIQGLSFFMLDRKESVIESYNGHFLQYYREYKFYKNASYISQFSLGIARRLSTHWSVIGGVTTAIGSLSPDKGYMVDCREITYSSDNHNFKVFENHEIKPVGHQMIQWEYKGHSINYTLGIRYAFGKQKNKKSNT